MSRIHKHEHVNSARSRFMQRTYGITFSDYRRLFSKQGGKCAICRCAPPSGVIDEDAKVTLCVDHDHATGEVRGLLCGNCNSGLGMFRDSTESLQNAIEYLKGGGKEAPKVERKELSRRQREIKRRKDLRKLIASQARDKRETEQRFDRAVDRWS